MKRFWMWIGLIMLGMGGLSAQEFTAFLSKKTVRVGEAFKVSFRLTNVQQQAIDYPEFTNLQVIGGPNISQQFQMSGNQSSLSITHSFVLRATQEGSYTIGAASTKLGGKKVKTAPLTVKVVKGNAAAAVPNAATARKQQETKDLEKQIKEALFLRTLLSNRDVYQGEQITVTYKLYNLIQPYELE